MDGFSFPQVLAIKSCQNLRKVPKKTKPFLPKPEEVPERPKKTKVPEVLGPGDLQNFGFFSVPPQVLTVFFLKTLPEPEELPKKPKSRGENLAKT